MSKEESEGMRIQTSKQKQAANVERSIGGKRSEEKMAERMKEPNSGSKVAYQRHADKSGKNAVTPSKEASLKKLLTFREFKKS
jgi:hypothetical protein